MAFTIEYKKSAYKALLKLDVSKKYAFLKAFETIAESENTDHEELDIKAMKGSFKGFFRLRIGTYRAIFEMQNGRLVLLVLKLQARGDVYKR